MVGGTPGTMGNNRWRDGTVAGGMAETMGTLEDKDRNKENNRTMIITIKQ